MRWFQIAFTEADVGSFSPRYWAGLLRKMRADGLCLSAGGGIAFYPSRVEGHGHARGLAGRDPFGSMVEVARAIGCRVMARIDPHAMPARSFAAHPEWAARTADGAPRRHGSAPDLYLTCPYTDYNFVLMPQVLREIAREYDVDGFFGNRVATLGICYCEGCRRLYREAEGAALPHDTDPAKPQGRRYWNWTHRRVLALIDLWHEAIRKEKPDALFTPGSERWAPLAFDGKAMGERLAIAFTDRQARTTTPYYPAGTRIWSSGRYARELRAFMQDKPVGNIIGVGVEEPYRWKNSVQDAAEMRVWAASAIAQGARPWITRFGADDADRRWVPVVTGLYQWLARHERYLRNTRNLARIGLVLDLQGPALVGGTDRQIDLEGHRTGFHQALLEARLPFDMIDTAFLEPEHLARFRCLVLPNVMVLTNRQCEALRAFVEAGGRIVATHATSLYDETGARRTDFALSDLFGCHFAGREIEGQTNSYLTLRHPHPALQGLEDEPRTIGTARRLEVEPHGVSLDPPLTLVPSYPDLPMERAYSEEPRTDIAMAYCRKVGLGRVVYLPMDIDRTFEELGQAPHQRLMESLVRWATDEEPAMQVEGQGLLDVAYWQQATSFAAHLVNYTNPMAMKGAFREAIPAGPFTVTLAVPREARITAVRLLEAEASADYRREGDRLIVTVPEVIVHEIIAIDFA